MQNLNLPEDFFRKILERRGVSPKTSQEVSEKAQKSESKEKKVNQIDFRKKGWGRDALQFLEEAKAEEEAKEVIKKVKKELKGKKDEEKYEELIRRYTPPSRDTAFREKVMGKVYSKLKDPKGITMQTDSSYSGGGAFSVESALYAASIMGKNKSQDQKKVEEIANPPQGSVETIKKEEEKKKTSKKEGPKKEEKTIVVPVPKEGPKKERKETPTSTLHPLEVTLNCSKVKRTFQNITIPVLFELPESKATLSYYNTWFSGGPNQLCAVTVKNPKTGKSIVIPSSEGKITDTTIFFRYKGEEDEKASFFFIYNDEGKRLFTVYPLSSDPISTSTRMFDEGSLFRKTVKNYEDSRFKNGFNVGDKKVDNVLKLPIKMIQSFMYLDVQYKADRTIPFVYDDSGKQISTMVVFVIDLSSKFEHPVGKWEKKSVLAEEKRVTPFRTLVEKIPEPQEEMTPEVSKSVTISAPVTQPGTILPLPRFQATILENASPIKVHFNCAAELAPGRLYGKRVTKTAVTTVENVVPPIVIPFPSNATGDICGVTLEDENGKQWNYDRTWLARIHDSVPLFSVLDSKGKEYYYLRNGVGSANISIVRTFLPRDESIIGPSFFMSRDTSGQSQEIAAERGGEGASISHGSFFKRTLERIFEKYAGESFMYASIDYSKKDEFLRENALPIREMFSENYKANRDFTKLLDIEKIEPYLFLLPVDAKKEEDLDTIEEYKNHFRFDGTDQYIIPVIVYNVLLRTPFKTIGEYDVWLPTNTLISLLVNKDEMFGEENLSRFAGVTLYNYFKARGLMGRRPSEVYARYNVSENVATVVKRLGDVEQAPSFMKSAFQIDSMQIEGLLYAIYLCYGKQSVPGSIFGSYWQGKKDVRLLYEIENVIPPVLVTSPDSEPNDICMFFLHHYKKGRDEPEATEEQEEALDEYDFDPTTEGNSLRFEMAFVIFYCDVELTKQSEQGEQMKKRVYLLVQNPNADIQDGTLCFPTTTKLGDKAFKYTIPWNQNGSLFEAVNKSFEQDGYIYEEPRMSLESEGGLISRRREGFRLFQPDLSQFGYFETFNLFQYVPITNAITGLPFIPSDKSTDLKSVMKQKDNLLKHVYLDVVDPNNLPTGYPKKLNIYEEGKHVRESNSNRLALPSPVYFIETRHLFKVLSRPHIWLTEEEIKTLLVEDIPIYSGEEQIQLSQHVGRFFNAVNIQKRVVNRPEPNEIQDGWV